MGRRGPAPKPTNLRLLRGEKYVNKDEPKVKGEISPPNYLKGDALKKWKEVTPVLINSGMMTAADITPFARYCTLFELWLKYQKACKAGHDQFEVFNPDGSLKYAQVSPNATMYAKLGQQLLRLEQEFGMTPSARSGISLPNNNSSDELGKFLKKEA